MSDLLKGLPEQDCQGPFCPVTDNLRVNDKDVIGRRTNIWFVALPAYKFTELSDAGETAQKNGERARLVLKIV